MYQRMWLSLYNMIQLVCKHIYIYTKHTSILNNRLGGFFVYTDVSNLIIDDAPSPLGTSKVSQFEFMSKFNF